MSEEHEEVEDVASDDAPWRSYLPKSLEDRARDAVSEAPLQVRQMVDSGIELSKAAPDDAPSAGQWLEWVAALPWGRLPPPLPVDIEEAARVLDAAHRGDDPVKQSLLDRIMGSWLLGSARTGHRLRPLLLVGPPGTGKSTLARAAAEAMGRPCIFVSVPAALHDGVYLVGCSRAYRAAEPGAIIQGVRGARTRRLVVILDEVDKVISGSTFDGPSLVPTLLELLDGHATWTDRYLQVPFDLSEVLYIATANTLATVQEPLLDRCDIVEIPGLSLDERLAAARFDIWPKLVSNYGLIEALFPLDDDALHCLVVERAENNEAGLRGVESRLEACLLRAIRLGFGGVWPVPVTRELIQEALSPRSPRGAGRRMGFVSPRTGSHGDVADPRLAGSRHPARGR